MKELKTNSLQARTLYTFTQLLLLLLLFLQFNNIESAKNTITLPGCPQSCGAISIPYPFGIGLNCSLSPKFNVTCKGASRSTPYLGTFEILNISLSLGQARLRSPISSQCYNNITNETDYTFWKSSWPTAVGFNGKKLARNVVDGTNVMTLMYFGDSFNFNDNERNKLWETSFKFNHEKNKFVVIGCDTLAYVSSMKGTDLNVSKGGCVLVVDHTKSATDGSCSGIGCCQTAIPSGAFAIRLWFDERYNYKYFGLECSHCSFAMLVEEAEFKFKTTYLTTDELSDATLPMVIDWAIAAIGIGTNSCHIPKIYKNAYACRSSNSQCLPASSLEYLCHCSRGYEGNPYLQGGCQDIDECANQNACSKSQKCHNFEGGYRCSCPFGWLSNHKNPRECNLNIALVIGMTIMLGFVTAFGIILLYVVIAKHIKLFEKNKKEKLKHKFFVQNQGLLLQQLIKASPEDTTQRMRILGLDELETATNNFNSALIIGRGGHGEVFKDILSDQHVVAIKRSKMVDQAEIHQFINEVALLSQFNHRNIVKLYGCCLETEVPLLVYEFISNGALSNHLHVEGNCSLTWKHRLRIALETAGAISYLHSSACISVFHRDVKSSNILLDDYLTAKVSDFGASRSVQIDQTGVTTAVQGTFGYLDPEYFRTGRLTPKSDVYSFGVILAELLTRQKALVSSRVFEGGSLVEYFSSAMKESRLFEILDPQIVNEGQRTELEAVAKLAEMCLRMEREERPTMKEAEVQLEVMWRANQQPKQYPWRSESLEDRQLMLFEEGTTSIQCSFEQELQS